MSTHDYSGIKDGTELAPDLAWVRLACGLIVIRKLRTGALRGKTFRLPLIPWNHDKAAEVIKARLRRQRRAERKARQLLAWSPAWAFGGER